MATTRETAVLTVAEIRRLQGDGDTQFLFNERQRIFTLKGEKDSLEAYRGILENSLENELPVEARLDLRRPIIHKVEVLDAGERDEFRGRRTLLDKPEKALAIDVGTVDPIAFNFVGANLKSRAFELCTRVIPSYKKAKEIFDFCAQQSCHLGGPHAVTPCIPFQYVRDGCYARAHKMYWIITTKYKFCCEKIFSFANRSPDVLAVEATKWGGCCVSWWYHVAPLVRVAIRLGGRTEEAGYVIDPGMFDAPVPASQWLASQESKTCDPHAKVSMYSIQQGTAYQPANSAGTKYTTDPTYAATDQTLIAYGGLKTC
jgi:hypothetical protein